MKGIFVGCTLQCFFPAVIQYLKFKLDLVLLEAALMDEAARDGKPELPDVDDTMPDLDHELAEEEQDPGAADEPVE